MFDTLRQKFAELLLPSRDPLSAVAVNGLPPSVSGSLDADGLTGIIREAEGGQMDRYLRLCAEVWGGDTTVLACSFHRKAGLLSQPWQINAAEGSGPDGEMKADLLRRQFMNCAGVRGFLNHSLDSFMWPVALSLKQYKPSTTPGLYYDLAALEPVPFYRLDFQGGGGEPAGTLRLKQVDAAGQILSGLTDPLKAIEAIVHRGHLLKTFPDTWGGPFRAALFWWFFSVCGRQWWARSLNKSGLPFLVGRVAEADKKGKASLLRAFNSVSSMLGLVVSEGTKIEVHRTLDAAATDSFDRFHKLCRQELSKLITGSSQTVEAEAQGLGGGQAAVADGRFDNITQHDGAELAETIKSQIFRPWLQINGLGCEACPEISWGATVDDAAAKATIVKTAFDAGLQLTDAGIEDFNQITSLEFARQIVAPEGGGAGSGPAAAGAPAASQALNGIQIKALSDLVSAVATGQIPYDSAVNTARAGFPAIPQTVLDGIFLPVRPAPATPTPGVDGFSARPSVPALRLIDLSRQAGDQINEAAAADLAGAFRGDLAPLRRILRDSSTADEFEANVLAFYSDWQPGKAARVIEEALAAHAANGFLKSATAGD